MSSQKISNEMIYELLKKQSEDIRELRRDMNQKFDQVEKRFNQVDARLNGMDQRLVAVEDKLERVSHRVYQLEDKVDGIRISWSTKLVGGILATSASVSAIVAFLMTSIL